MYDIASLTSDEKFKALPDDLRNEVLKQAKDSNSQETPKKPGVFDKAKGVLDHF